MDFISTRGGSAVSAGTAKLLKNIVIPSTYKNFKVTEILEYGFQSSKAETIIIPDSVTTIGHTAFNGCPSLTSIIIPDSVTSIDYNAFYKCTSLTSVTIGDGVISIGGNAFSYCTSLTNVYYKGTIEDWCNISFGDSLPIAESTIIFLLLLLSIISFTFARAVFEATEVPPNLQTIIFL